MFVCAKCLFVKLNIFIKFKKNKDLKDAKFVSFV